MESSLAEEIGIVEAAQLMEELLKVLCSQPWLNEILVPLSPRRDRWRYDPEAMPPGMILCPSCNRRCPPHTLGLPLCCDCEVERSQEWLDSRITALLGFDQEFGYQLARRWWRRISYVDFVEGWSDSVWGYLAGSQGGTVPGGCNHEAVLLANRHGSHGLWPESLGYDEPTKRGPGGMNS